MKEELPSDTVFAFYDPSNDLQLVADASNHAVDGVLLQKDNDDTLKPTCYINRALTIAELKHSITEKEALNLVWCKEKLHLYLYGKRFGVIVSHQPLKYIFSAKSKLNARISRWQIKLQGYDFNVVCKKGSANIADYLSWKCQVDDDSSSAETCLYLNYLSNMKVPKVVLLDQVMNESKKDAEIVAIRNALLTDKWESEVVKP